MLKCLVETASTDPCHTEKSFPRAWEKSYLAISHFRFAKLQHINSIRIANAVSILPKCRNRFHSVSNTQTH